MNVSTLLISEQIEARLTAAARQRGISGDANIADLMNERGDRDAPSQPGTETVFEQGCGMFGNAEDAALINKVVSLACTDRRRTPTGASLTSDGQMFSHTGILSKYLRGNNSIVVDRLLPLVLSTSTFIF